IRATELAEAAPITLVGSIPYSEQYPSWRIDLFDFGAGSRAGDELLIAFEHEYPNPRRKVPREVVAIPEFDGVANFVLRAERQVADDGTLIELCKPWRVIGPPRCEPVI